MSRFSIIGISTPGEWADVSQEVEAIGRYLTSGALDLFHVRKPETDSDYTRRLLEILPSEFLPKIILHSHFDLINDFKVGGVHIKKESEQLNGYEGIRSRSCHSLAELDSPLSGSFTYSFLSPIFDSISKAGYKSAFEGKENELIEISKRIPVIALGGVTPQKFKKIFDLKFAGAALLGYLWTPNSDQSRIIAELLKYKIQ